MKNQWLLMHAGLAWSELLNIYLKLTMMNQNNNIIFVKGLGVASVPKIFTQIHVDTKIIRNCDVQLNECTGGSGTHNLVLCHKFILYAINTSDATQPNGSYPYVTGIMATILTSRTPGGNFLIR